MADFGSFLSAAGIGGGTIGAAIVRLQLDANEYQAQLKAQHAQTQTSANAMGTSFSKFGALAKSGMLAAGAALVGFAVSAVKAASAVGEQLNRTREVFGDAADSVIAFSESAAGAFGLAQAEALSAASAFGAMAQSAGLSEDAAARMSTQLVGLAGDLASFNDADPSEMLDRLRAGLAGEAEPLRRFGVFISEARLRTVAYAEGIAQVGEELTDAEKISARYSIILQDTTAAQGDFARTLGESLPNQIRALTAETTNLAADIGKHLLPATLEFAKLARELADTAGPLLEIVFRDIGQAASELADIVRFVNDALTALADLIPGLGDDADAAASLFDRFRGAVVDLALNAVPAGDQLRIAAGYIDQVSAASAAARGELEGVGLSLEFFPAALEPVSTALSEAAAVFDEVGERARNFARLTDEEITKLSDSLKDEIPNIVGTITTYKETFTLSAQELKKITESWARIARTIASDLETLAESDLQPAMRAAIAGLPPEMRHAWVEGNARQRAAIEASIRRTLDFSGVIDDTVDAMAEGGSEAGQAFDEGMAAGIDQYVGSVISAASDAVTSAIDAARDAAEAQSPSRKMMRLGQDMIEGLIQGLEAEADRLRERLAKIIDHATSFRGTIAGGFSSFLDISGAFGLGAGDIQGFFATQVAGAQQFAAILKALQAQGISSALLGQIAGAGPQAIPFAQQLLQMGPAGIAEISGAFATISNLASQTAQGLSQAYYGSRMDELRDELRGLRGDVRLLQQILERPQRLVADFRGANTNPLDRYILDVIARAGLSRSPI